MKKGFFGDFFFGKRSFLVIKKLVKKKLLKKKIVKQKFVGEKSFWGTNLFCETNRIIMGKQVFLLNEGACF